MMTDHEGNRKIYLARGIQEGLETADHTILYNILYYTILYNYIILYYRYPTY